MNKVYLVGSGFIDEESWDGYDACIVVASSPEEAKQLAKDDGQSWVDKVIELGLTEPRVICSSLSEPDYNSDWE